LGLGTNHAPLSRWLADPGDPVRNDEVYRATEAYCREQPGFKPMEEWRAEISKTIAAQLQA
jgi:hypothetical protein